MNRKPKISRSTLGHFLEITACGQEKNVISISPQQYGYLPLSKQDQNSDYTKMHGGEVYNTPSIDGEQ